MSFVAPDSIVKPSPSIGKLVNDPAPKNIAPATTTIPTPATVPTPAAEPAQPEPAVAEPVAKTVQSEPAVTESTIVAPEPTPAVTESTIVAPEPTPAVTETTIVETHNDTSLQQQQPLSSPVENPEKYFEKFKEKWDEMVDAIFNKVPTLQAPLKNYPLEVKNDIVYLKLRNSMQVDDFSIKKVAVLQYLRNHFDPNINDVEVELDDKTEAKKYILDEKDKIKELQHQNPDFAEFMQTLNLQSCN